MNVKVNVIFYSMYGHVYRMAQAVAEGARQVEGAQVGLFQVQETLPDEILVETGAKQARQEFADVPVATIENLSQADGLIVGTPTRFGNMSSQMRAFWDQTGPLWMDGALIGKVGSVFTSTASQHGGQETTIISTMLTLFHHGLIMVGVPYSEERLLEMGEMTGGTPYGASTIADADGSRWPSENELAIARFQGQHVAEVTKKLHGE